MAVSFFDFYLREKREQARGYRRDRHEITMLTQINFFFVETCSKKKKTDTVW